MSLQVTHPSRLYLTLSLTVVIFQLCLLFLSYFFVPVFSSVLLSDSFSTFLFDVSIFYISLPLCLFLWIPPVFYSGPVRLPGLTSAFTLSLFFLILLILPLPSRVFPRVILCVFLSLHLWPISPSLSPLLFLWTCSLLFIRLLQWLTTAYWL